MPILTFDIEYRYADDLRGIPLSVELEAGGTTRLLAFLDTGAKHCLFQSEYADLLGLNLEQGSRLEFSPAGGGSIIGFGHQVKLTVLGESVESMVYFTSHPGFTRNVLGRQGWFHHFRFGLVLYDSLLYLSRYDA